ncbi:hypothetical protein TNCV_4534541 [Trichonephila clavipes]|nr:hypothetical protein TNCV_4534541 [Trichonephila clavipes]
MKMLYSRFCLAYGCLVIKWLQTRGYSVMSSSLQPLKLIVQSGLLRVKYVETQTFSRWCGVEVKKWRCQLNCLPSRLTMALNDGSSSPKALELLNIGKH